MNQLKNKVAVIYGNGAIGSAVARSFARAGARVFLTGLTPSKLKAIADEIAFDGGIIETAQLNALDEQAVEHHMNEVIQKAGRIDISFNTIGIPQKEVQHVPLADLSVEDFSLPITTYTKSHFITAKAAAKRMIKQGSGVIIMHTANLSRVSAPLAGGRGAAWAALESLCRSFSVECGPYGVRAICLLTTAIPETPIIAETFKELFEAMSKTRDITTEEFDAMMADHTHRKRLTTLTELTEAAVFVSSDEASAITGTIFNLTAGMIA